MVISRRPPALLQLAASATGRPRFNPLDGIDGELERASSSRAVLRLNGFSTARACITSKTGTAASTLRCASTRP